MEEGRVSVLLCPSFYLPWGCRRVAIGDGRGAAESRPAVPAVSLLKHFAGERTQGCTRGAGRCRWSPAQGCGRREMSDGAELS